MTIDEALKKINKVDGLRAKRVSLVGQGKGNYIVELAYGPRGRGQKWKLLAQVKGKELIYWAQGSGKN